jgi:phosphoenolpyruvate carboxykinase (GTP)
MSFGSGYGGNSLLGKKCFALRIAMNIAYDEGWMAEHMLIMSVTNPQGVEKFICAAFPSACGKTNMAMLNPGLPGWKVQCIGDDIAWLRFKDGELRAINPEKGFFGVAPGTNMKTNPNAMLCFQKNSVFTNSAETTDGAYYWEGLEKETDPNADIITWLGKPFKIGQKENAPASHPNSRFTCPAEQCPIIHPDWENPEGVPISALIFGGRRPEGIPTVYEAFTWQHGVMIGAQVKSESTAAAEFKGKTIMHDPMAMRPFIGYNFGRYLKHWLSMDKPDRKMPKIFHVNWFRLTKDGKFVWPGFGDNIRIIDWICQRCDNKDVATESPLGYIPKPGTINCEGIEANYDDMFAMDKNYLIEDIEETKKWIHEQTGCDLPPEIDAEMDAVRKRLDAMK